MSSYLSASSKSTPWTLTIDKAGQYTIKANNFLVDRNINVNVAAAQFMLTGNIVACSKAGWIGTNSDGTPKEIATISAATITLGKTTFTNSDTYLTTTNTGFKIQAYGQINVSKGYVSVTSDYSSITGAAYIKAGALSAGSGSTAASGTHTNSASGVVITKVSSEPSSGYYITTTGSGTVSVSTAGWLNTQSKSSNTATAYYTLNSAKVGGIGFTAQAGAVSSSGLTLSDTNTSGISVSGSGQVSAVATVTEGYTQGITSSSYTGSSQTKTRYITDVTVPAGKTLNSVTLTQGSSSSALTTLTTLTTGTNTKIGTFTNSGIIGAGAYSSSNTQKMTNNGTISHLTNNGAISAIDGSGSISILTGSNTITEYSATGLIQRMIGSRTLSSLGYSSTAGALTISSILSGSTLAVGTNSGTTKLTTNNGSLTVTTNASGKTATISTNAGTTTVTSNTGTTNIGTNSGTTKLTTNNGTITVSTNSASKSITVSSNSGNVIINGGGSSDKGVTVAGKVTTVDGGTAVTNSNGDLITASISAAGGSLSGETLATITNGTLIEEDNITVLTDSSGNTLTDSNGNILTLPIEGSGSGIAIKVSANNIKRSAITYSNKEGWVNAHTNEIIVAEEDNLSILSKTYYLSKIVVGPGKSIQISDTVNDWTWSVDSSGNISIY